ncbi:hypothetical protein [Oceaniglobus ichthyenteri]|uniref:hypothetical protein n=1 Tax=Oceaniglobus ichthyenteri TaxID=2136177 RepID=UPI000F84721C|nr:hypothetical protein [Oceaniglobus ichthyenteri]
MPNNPPRFYRAAGWAAVAAFVLFAGNIALVKLGGAVGFVSPRLSTIAEFITLLVTTFLGVAYLIGEERQKTTTEEEIL